MKPRVIGLDLSLSATGVAGDGWTEVIKPPANCRSHDRLYLIKNRLRDFTRHAALVVVEGPSYGNQGRQSGHHERAGLWWLVAHDLWCHGTPVAVAPPATVKRYATGKGNADKDTVLLAAARRFPWFVGDNNAADALWLAAAGFDRLGHPLADMPAAHRKALDAVAWPDQLREDAA